MNRISQLFHWLGGGHATASETSARHRLVGGVVAIVLLLFCFFVSLGLIEYFETLPEREYPVLLQPELDTEQPADKVDSLEVVPPAVPLDDRAGFSRSEFLAANSAILGVGTGILLTLILLLMLRGILSYNQLYQRFQRFLWWCAGARIDFLEQSPTDHAKFFGIGGTVLFTALMAMFAGGYAFFTAFDDLFMSLLFGVFWGALIFNLDRYIVSSSGKGDGTAKITKEEWTTAIPRLALAILIAFVVATPLELKIFEKEIEVEIQKIIDEKRRELARGQDYNLEEIQRIKDEIARLKDIQEDSKEDVTDDPRVNFGEEQIAELNERLAPLQERLDRIERDKSTYRRNIRTLEAQLIGTDRDSPERQRLERQIDSEKNRLRRRSREGDRIEAEMADIQGEVDAIDSNIDAVRNANAESYGVRLDQTNNEIERLEKQLFNILQSRRGEIQRYEEVARQYTGLMAQLDALDRLTVRPVFEERRVLVESPAPNDLLVDSTEAASSDSMTLFPPPVFRTEYVQAGTEWTPIFYAKWLITLLFICIEIAPILFKLMTEFGPYDDLLEAERQASEARKIKKISELNMEINNEIRINTAKYQSQLDVDVMANKEIMETVAKAQNAVAKMAIEDWRDKQLEKVSANPEAFIHSKPASNGSSDSHD